MRSRVRGVLAAAASAVLCAAAAAGCGGGPPAGGDGKLVVWSIEDTADRVETQKRLLADFSARTGIEAELVAVSEDQYDTIITSAAAANQLPDVIGALSLAGVRDLETNELLDTAVPTQVVEGLGRDTFTAAALELTRTGDRQLAVPSDGWAQLLFYRRDLFQRAGLPAPDTYDAIARAAAALDQGDVAGIVAGTAPGEGFTQQTFEHLALANGCQLVDAGGDVQLDSPACVETFRLFGDLIREHSTAGNQDADTTRASYFAGRSAMVVWSSFLLDELAGLRDDALPSCPECSADPTYLAKNTGVVTAIRGPSGPEPAAFGELVSWVVTADADKEPARRLLEYMMSDAYEPWLGVAPEGKIPTRNGTREDPRRYATAWQRLEAGVDRKAPLAQFYDPALLQAVADSPASFERWGLRQGQGELVGAMLGQLPVPAAIGELLGGADPAEAAATADAAVEDIQEDLGG